MRWLNKIPKLSLVLLIAIYVVYGWLHGSWLEYLVTKEQFWNQWLETQIELAIGYGIGLVAIILIIVFFTAPLTLVTLGMSNWFKANSRAFLAISVSIIIFATVIEHPAFLARSLILSASAMLFRLDLQTLGYSRKTSQLILIGFSLISFTGGILLYNYERLASYWY